MRRSFGLASFGGSPEGCKQYQLSLPSLGQTSASRELHLSSLESGLRIMDGLNLSTIEPATATTPDRDFHWVQEISFNSSCAWRKYCCSKLLVENCGWHLYHWLCLPTDCWTQLEASLLEPLVLWVRHSDSCGGMGSCVNLCGGWPNSKILRRWRIRNSALLLNSEQFFFGPTIWIWSPSMNFMVTWQAFLPDSREILKLCAWSLQGIQITDQGMNMPIFMPAHLSKYIFHQARSGRERDPTFSVLKRQGVCQ